MKTTHSFLPEKKPVKILITSGASCPDAIVEGVIEKIISFYPVTKSLGEMAKEFA
jgi:4-hydroxy-3-methylbut-2-enyl diphosphate reductase